MEKKIIVSIKPFCLNQKVYAWTEKGREEFEYTIQDLPKKLPILAKQLQIDNIDLIGNEAYLLKIKNDMVNNKFDKQKLNVIIKKSKGE